MFKKINVLISMSVMCIGTMCNPVWANDGIGSVAVGGIILGKTDTIAMRKEILNVSPKQIAVDYEFLNESSHDEIQTIVFPLPEYSAAFGYEDTYYGEPEDFTISVDNQPVSFKTIIQAYKNKVNITSEFKKIGLSDRQIAIFPMSSPFENGSVGKMKTLTKEQITALKKMNLLTDETSDSSLAPSWTVKITYQWTQLFSAGKILHVHHQYKPFVAAGPAYSTIEDEFIKKYCMSPDFIKSWKKKSQGNYLNAVEVSYILKTGNTWKNGIEDFTLNLKKDNNQELASVCFPGSFKKTDDKTLSVHLTNFKPEEDLNVYFSNVPSINEIEKIVAPKINK